MIKKLLLYFCTFNLLLFAGCDPIFGPVIRNGLDHDVRVYYTYTNGTEFEYVIPPDNDLLWYHQNIYILNSLVVYEGEDVRFELSEEKLKKIRISAKSPKVEIWNIGSKQVRLISLKELRKLQN